MNYNLEPCERRLLLSTIAVTSTADDGSSGTLRDAITIAAAGDVIDMRELAGQVTLASELTIDKDLTILGSSNTLLTLSGNNSNRILNVAAGVTLSLSDLSLADGNSGSAYGGAIYSQGSLALTRVTIRDSVAGVEGGAIFLTGSSNTLDISDSTFSGNSAVFTGALAPMGGGALAVEYATTQISGSTFDNNLADGTTASNGSPIWGGAAFFYYGTQTIVNCTFYSNTAQGSDTTMPACQVFGGAIGAYDSSLTLVNNTIFQNSAIGGSIDWSEGGGVVLDTTDATLINNIIMANSATKVADVYISASSTVTTGGNYVGDDGGAASLVDGVNGNIVTGGPSYPANFILGNYGGPTCTVSVDAHFPTGISTSEVPLVDQRGLPRTGAPNIGAYQYQGPPRTGFGNALLLDGVDDTVFIPNNTALQNSDFSVQAWMNLDPHATGINTIFSYGDPNSADGFALAYDIDNQRFVFQVGGTSCYGNFAFADLGSTWNSILATHTTSNTTLYVNGTAIGSDNTTNPTVYPPVAQGYIGSRYGAADFFMGQLDEVQIFNVAIGPTFIPGAEQNVVADWHFDDVAVTQLDYSASTHADGRLLGADPATAIVASTVPLQVTLPEDNVVYGNLPAYDPDWYRGGPEVWQLVTPPTHGTLTSFNGDGTFYYEPDPNFNGIDTFTYRYTRLNEDATGISAPATVTLNVTPVNDPPVFTSTIVDTAVSGTPYIYNITASDVDGNPLSFYSAYLLPDWLTLTDHGDGTATLSGMPNDSSYGGYIGIAVTDGVVSVVQGFNLTVDHPPVFTSTIVDTATSGTPYVYNLTATDVDGDPLSFYSADPLPDWLTLTDNGNGTATLSGVPDNSSSGGNISIMVTDGVASVAQDFNLTVDLPPAFQTQPPLSATSDVLYSYSIAAYDPDGSSISFAGTYPSWLTLLDHHDGTATLSGTPANGDIGANGITISACDGAITTNQSFTIDVAPAPPGPPFSSGVFSDMAQGPDGTLYVAWYDSNAQNLKYAERSPSGIWSATTIIDDASADTGWYVSLALDGNGKPGIAYRDETNTNLKYAHFNGTSWDVTTVDDLGNAGLYPSLMYYDGIVPLISYYRKTSGDLKFAKFAWNKQAKRYEWSTVTIDSAGNCGRHSSLAEDPNGGVGIVYESTSGHIFRYAKSTNTGWDVSDVKPTQMIGDGAFTSLVYNSAGLPAFSYYDSYPADLMFARFDGHLWQVEDIASHRAIGLYTNLALRSDGGYNIVYWNKSADLVALAPLTATGELMPGQVLATGQGNYLSVAFSPDGEHAEFLSVDSASKDLVLGSW